LIPIGIDFGGTKIEAAALGADGSIRARTRLPNPGNYAEALQTVRVLVDDLEKQLVGRCTVGVGAPGSVDPASGVMRNSSTVWLNGRRFREDLELALGRSIRLANDANCLALSESVDGAGRGAHTVFAVILGTGCGGGIVVDGRLLEGANGIAGEWGHITLPWPKADEYPGSKCWCGRYSCIETWVSGTGVARDHLLCSGRSMSAESIVQCAQRGDAVAAATVGRFIDRLGRALAMICNLFDPDVLVFGGGLSKVSELYELLPGSIKPYVFGATWQARLTPASWGDSSGVRGAARLWASV